MNPAPRGKKAQTHYKRRISVEENFQPEPDNIIEYIKQIDAPGTFFLIFFLILVYGWTAILSGNPLIITDAILLDYAQINSLLVQDFEIYRLITAMFVHAHFVHLGGNILFLLIFGLRFEELKGTKHLLLVYFIAGLAGNLFTLFLLWDANFASVGASGAVQGIFAAAVVQLYFDKQYAKGGIAMLSFMVLFFILMIGANTNVFAHFGGMLGGFLYSYTLHIIEKR